MSLSDTQPEDRAYGPLTSSARAKASLQVTRTAVRTGDQLFPPVVAIVAKLGCRYESRDFGLLPGSTLDAVIESVPYDLEQHPELVKESTFLIGAPRGRPYFKRIGIRYGRDGNGGCCAAIP